jgi:Zn-finger nucleic acid-binding protein
MQNEKDRFGETMKLVEKAKEDIYFAEKDRELIELLKAQLKEQKTSPGLQCPKCQGELATYNFLDVLLERCRNCEGMWLDRGELQAILRRVKHSPFLSIVDRLMGRNEES